MTNSKLLQQVTDTINTYSMLSQGDCVLVGLSGGADSVALLSVLLELREAWDLTLVAAHVNHGIRGEEADRDEQFCRTLCETLGVPLYVKHVNVPELVRETGESEETCGRRIRYQFFEELVKRESDKLSDSLKVATAHNANDAVETLLFNLARGAGLNGLASIPPVRDNVIRPLINSPRADIEAYLNEKGLSHVEDSSNGDTGYARNRIRHNVVPELVAVNAGAVSNMSRLMGLLREDVALLDRLAEQLCTSALVQTETGPAYKAEVLLEADPALRGRAIGRLLRTATGLAPEQHHIAAVTNLLLTGGKTQVLTGTYVSVKDNLLTFTTTDATIVTDCPAFTFELQETVELPYGILSCQLYQKDQLSTLGTVYEMSNRNDLLDYDKLICEPTRVRNRRPGDQYSPRFRHLTKSLKGLWNEASVPSEARGTKTILESGSTIAWVEDFGASANYMVTGQTNCVLQITITRR